MLILRTGAVKHKDDNGFPVMHIFIGWPCHSMYFKRPCSPSSHKLVLSVLNDNVTISLTPSCHNCVGTMHRSKSLSHLG